MSIFAIIVQLRKHAGFVGFYEPMANGDFVLTFNSPCSEILDFESLLNRYAQAHGIVYLSNDNALPRVIDGNSLPQTHILEFNHKS